MCSNSIFNLLKRVTDGSFLFLCKTFGLLFLPFLNMGAQISCPKKWYTDLKLALGQPLPWCYVLNFNSTFGGCFCLELGGVEEWTSSGVFKRWFLGGAGLSDVSLLKSQRSMSSISPLALTSKISSITSVMVEGS